MTSKRAKRKASEELERIIRICQEYTQLWSHFFNYFADGFESRKITPEAETQFFQVMSDLARKQYRVRFFVKEDCPADEKMLSILSEAVSLANIHEMTEAQFNKMQHSWHVIFIALNKSLGRLMQKRALYADPRGRNGKKSPQKASQEMPADHGAESHAPQQTAR